MTKEKINEFKQRLREGVVEFDFIKTDGTKRHAIGTTRADLIPSRPETKTYICKNIKWDVDGETTLPSEVTIKNVDAKLISEELEDELSDLLTESYGFTHLGFEFEEKIRKPKKLSLDCIYFYDLERGGSRSLRAESLINFI